MSWSVPFQSKKESETLSSDTYKRLMASRELDKQTEESIEEHVQQSILEGDISAYIAGSGEVPYQKRSTKQPYKSTEQLDAEIQADLAKGVR